jgi:glycosyltransferase involved in cell wall biosynthesis
MTRRVAVVAPEPIRPRMAGMGIRAFEIARALAGRFEVRLLVPNEDSEVPPAAGVTAVAAPPGSPAFLAEAKRCDCALVSGHAASAFFWAAPHVPTAVDWYDPFLIENFHYAADLGPEVEANDRAAWMLAMCRADLFLCASPEQKLFYSGLLVQGGRVTARSLENDPGLEGILAVVPFGVRAAPEGDPSAWRERLGANPTDPILFFGGLYDWHDPAPIFQIWPDLLAEFPGARIVFCENPNRSTTPQRIFEAAEARAARLGWKDRSIFFIPWSPYEKRGDLYGACALAINTCRPGLEAELSFRTRLLDVAAAGLPSVSIAGGSVARELASAGAGCSAEGAEGLLEGVRHFLRNEEARRCASRKAREFAARYSWEAVVDPLARFFEKPSISSRLDFPDVRPRARFRIFGKA